MSEVLALAKKLIAIPSITPNDLGCQNLIQQELEIAGFEFKTFHTNGVSNLFAWHGEGKPSLFFAGHTDVVPPGPLDQWSHPPFSPIEKDGYLYGRGAADMKSSLGAMVLSARDFVLQHPQHKGMIGFVITSDEEGPAIDGTVKIIEYLKESNIIPTYVVVGECSSNEKMGDAIKIGRRGSLHGEITIMGKQGHIAYPREAENAIHLCFKAFEQLALTEWDKGNTYFSPTTFQFYEIKSGVAGNVIPGILTAKFNFRFAPTSRAEDLQGRVQEILNQHHLKYSTQFTISSHPYFTGICELSDVVSRSIEKKTGIKPDLNTFGGTSDGRFFASLGAQIIELGPVNKTIHKINECTNIKELEDLQSIYSNIIATLLL